MQQQSTAVYPDRNMIRSGERQPTITPPPKGYLQLCHAPCEHTNFIHFLFYDLPQRKFHFVKQKNGQANILFGGATKGLEYQLCKYV